MKIVIHDKKKELFISLFQLLKNCSSSIHCTFETDFLHIQGMDKSHVCLFDVKLYNEIFTQYTITKKTQLCFDSSTFYSIISTKSDDQSLIIQMKEEDQDTLYIHFCNYETEEKENIKKCKKEKKTDFKKFFKIPLADYSYSELVITENEYDAEFTILAKDITDIFSQLNNFGDDIMIHCSQEDVQLTTNGVTGEMRVDVPIDDLSSYAILEDAEFTLAYSLLYLNKLCMTNKLTKNIDFSLSSEYPMKISYALGENSLLVFFIASKIVE
jgi:proliferating cell nuclear antigen PCNA